jgi:alkyl hydroperoxide reductase subunit D
MSQLALLSEELIEPARDVRLNLQSVMDESSSLTPSQRWLVALACAYASRNPRLTKAVQIDARAVLDDTAIADAQAAAALMAMNNIFYRFRHMVGNENYNHLPARLRMNRLARPSVGRTDFELMCLSVSAVHGCESCIRAHERVVLEGGLTAQNVHDAVRIAATLHAAAVALEMRLEL